MEIIIQKSILIEALQIITPITDKSSSKPVLSNFLLSTVEGREDTVEFSATDYEIGLSGKYPVHVKRPGAVCVSAKKLLEISKEFQGEEVLIRSDEQMWVTVESTSARLRLPSLEIGLYPRMEVRELPQVFHVAVDALKKAIDSTLFAVQATETRKALMGVCLNLDVGHHAKWTATDGHRLAQIQVPVRAESIQTPPEIIVPKKSLVEVRKVLDGVTGEVKMRFDERTLVMEAGDIVLNTRLVEGKFPNVDPIIPKDNDKVALIPKDTFSNALRIMSIMSGDKIKPVKFTLQNHLIRVESEKAEYGDASVDIPVKYTGEPLQIGFNARYLLDVFNVMDKADEVKVLFKGALNPCLITHPEDEGFLSVVMPLRIEW